MLTTRLAAAPRSRTTGNTCTSRTDPGFGGLRFLAVRLSCVESWAAPPLPRLPAPADSPPTLRVHDTAADAAITLAPHDPVRLYVCGITPYDATHLGHAATYLAFD